MVIAIEAIRIQEFVVEKLPAIGTEEGETVRIGTMFESRTANTENSLLRNRSRKR